MATDTSSWNLRDIINSVVYRWYIPAISIVLCLAAAYTISFYLMDPVYQSNTTLYIGKKIDKDVVISYNDMILNSQLVKDYRELVKSRFISKPVIEQLGFSDMSVEQLAKKLNVQNKNDTRIIEISTKDTDPKRAMDIANTVAEVFKSKVIEIMQVDSIQIIDKAEKPINPVSPDKTLNLIIAFIMGITIGLFIVLSIEFFDNTVKTLEDIEKYLNLPVIGTIPAFPKE